jgi:hypothetical protein
MGLSRTIFFAGIDRTVLTLWVGGLWISGYLVAPTLFSMLNDRQLAGLLAGQIFQSMNYIGLFAGGYLLVSTLVRAGNNSFRQWRIWVLISMLILIIIAAFVIQPMMQELKTQGISEGTIQAKEFGRLHGLSSILFLINSILGLLLVITGLDQEKG